MPRIGRTEQRLALAILLTAVLPLVASIYFASSLIDRAFAQAHPRELEQHLEQAIGAYQDLAKALKDGMRAETEAMAASSALQRAAAAGDGAATERALAAAFPAHATLVSLAVTRSDGGRVASRDRGVPLDERRERALEVQRPLGEGEGAPLLVAVFATPRARLDEVKELGEVLRTFATVRREQLGQRLDKEFFAAILVLTIVVAIGLGSWLARSVTSRIAALAEATSRVAEGDLSVRVRETGDDELTELSRAFNRMLAEVEGSRARIEFLQRMGAWQEMARRLAHEIKNPLTPILLAAEECHKKYPGGDPAYQRLLDTTLEIVEEEVGTLRRLVGEFSAFARLPRAELTEGDLGEILREQRERDGILEAELGGGRASIGDDDLAGRATIEWRIDEGPMPMALDRQMLGRVLANVLRNAVQAIRDAARSGHVVVRAWSEGESILLVVDDDGPGVPDELRASIFDPYVTTKSDGTGLGLSIVKKIVVEHGGAVVVERSPLGGARFRFVFPRLGSAVARAAQASPTPSARPGPPPSPAARGEVSS